MSTLSAQPAAVDGAVELGDGLAVVGTAVVGAGVVGARSFDRTLVPSMHVYGSTKHACNGVGPHFGARELLHHAVDVLGVGVAAGRIAGPFSAPRNVPSTTDCVYDGWMVPSMHVWGVPSMHETSPQPRLYL